LADRRVGLQSPSFQECPKSLRLLGAFLLFPHARRALYDAAVQISSAELQDGECAPRFDLAAPRPPTEPRADPSWERSPRSRSATEADPRLPRAVSLSQLRLRFECERERWICARSSWMQQSPREFEVGSKNPPACDP